MRNSLKPLDQQRHLWPTFEGAWFRTGLALALRNKLELVFHNPRRNAVNLSSSTPSLRRHLVRKERGNPLCQYQFMHNHNIHTRGPSRLTARCFVYQRRCYWLGNSFPCSSAFCTPPGRMPITTAPRLLSMPAVGIGLPSISVSSSGLRSSLLGCSSCTLP